MKKYLILFVLLFISASLYSQEVKTVIIYDSADHSQWHSEQVTESKYAPYEFCFDLDKYHAKIDSIKALYPIDSNLINKKVLTWEERQLLIQEREDSIKRKTDELRKLIWPDYEP